MENEKNMVTMFHCTTGLRKESILNEGLLISKAISSLHSGKKSTFLSVTPQHCFGNTCFIVHVPESWVTQTVNHWEYTCDRDIPPENISYHSYEEDE